VNIKVSKHISLILVVFSIFFLTSCDKEPQRPFVYGLPDKDIVFVPSEYPAYSDADISTLGFINADGTGREEYSFLFAGGAKSMYGMTSYTQYADTPRWSTSGGELTFGIRNTAPNIRLIDSQGYMYGKNCDTIGEPISFDRNNYLIKVLHKDDLIFSQYQYLIDENHIALVRFNLKNCTVLSVSSLAVPSGIVFTIGNETASGRFIISYYQTGTDIPNFFIYEPMQEDYQIFSGFFPELNNDGTLLAYYSAEGALNVKNVETGAERIIAEVTSNTFSLASNMLSSPSWSPDSQWIVYSTDDGKIYKINVETEEKIYLTHGWSPDWR